MGFYGVLIIIVRLALGYIFNAGDDSLHRKSQTTFQKAKKYAATTIHTSTPKTKSNSI